MKNFKFNVYVHIINIFSILLCASAYFDSYLGLRTFEIFPIALTIIALFNFINALVTIYIISDKGIRFKNLFKNIEIDWNEVQSIMLQPSGKFVKVSVAIFSKDKKITITTWTKNYKDFLKFLTDKCAENGNIKIHPKVFEIIN